MRIDGKPGVTPVSAASAARRTGSGGFSLGETPSNASAPRAGGAGPTASLDAILALQGEEDPAERRRKAARWGRDLLDGLDRLKAAILSGRVPPDELARIAGRLAERRETTDDPRLDAILEQIALRAEVEIAKLEVSKRAARERRDVLR